VLHAMYLYNASLLCSRGSAEYIFWAIIRQ
jgi:hypothetical protein